MLFRSYQDHTKGEGGVGVTLYRNYGAVDTQMYFVDAAHSSTQQVSFYGMQPGATAALNLCLSDNLPQTPTEGTTPHTYYYLSNEAGENFANASFKGYTYGNSANRTVTWSSDNPDVVTVGPDGTLEFTGAGGSANVSVTFSWRELDGKDGGKGTLYQMTASVVVNNTKFAANIRIGDTYPDSYAVNNFSKTATLSPTVTWSSEPLGEENLPAGSWEWTAENEDGTPDTSSSVITNIDNANTAQPTVHFNGTQIGRASCRERV